MRIRHASIVLAALAFAGCASMQAGERPDGTVRGSTVLTQDDVKRVSARNAMELVVRTRHHLDIRQKSDGEVSSITSRGVGSLVVDAQIAVIVDGALVADALGALRTIPANNIRRIEILTSRQATPIYGTNAGNGAIIVTTAAMMGG